VQKAESRKWRVGSRRREKYFTTKGTKEHEGKTLEGMCKSLEAEVQRYKKGQRLQTEKKKCQNEQE
jgi:hypothetical protein